MAGVETPHFALPFRLDGRQHAVCNEQDTVEDVADCVEAVLLTRPGEREDHPNFGSDDLVFGQRPLDLDSVLAQLQAWEPRATLLIEEGEDLLDEAIQRVTLRIAAEEA